MTIEKVITHARELGESEVTEAGTPWVNAAGEELPDISRQVDRVGREIARWITQTRGNQPSLLNRVAYRAPEHPYVQMETAKGAVKNDDIVSGVVDVTEALMFQGIKWEAEDADDADIFNQMARDLNLDAFARQWHREDFTNSQAIVGLWWGYKDYAPREKKPKKGERKTPGPKRNRTKNVWCPIAYTFLDPHKVVPLRPGAFGQDRLAWLATDQEIETWMKLEDDPYLDPVMAEFMIGPADIDRDERRYLAGIGIDWRRLIELNPSRVFRITQTKMSYERFPDVRLRSVFPLLDLKQQLIEADRVTLVGAANYILLVRQGDKDNPATQPEIDNLRDNFKVVAKLPVVVGDHRLSIDIITPDQTNVLDSTKYETIDRRILNRCIGALQLGSSGRTETGGTTLLRGISRMLENRRHMMKRMLEEQIARRVFEHPANEGIFETECNLAFTPRNVQIDADSEITKAMLTLRTQKEISRETVLEYFGLDQAVEALRREFEEENFDDIFQTAVPFDSPENAPQITGGQGGRPAGGGDSPQSPQGQTGGRTSTGNPSTGGS